VQYTGYLTDIRPVVAQSWMSVVPLRKGGGTRLKILEAMALGTPVLATTKGADGLDVTDGENILLADDPQRFAQQAMRLLRSPELRTRLAIAGRRLVMSKYDWRVVGPRFNVLVDNVGGDGPA
jgi:glycosyltransferase involved in cell wall biosynthesis